MIVVMVIVIINIIITIISTIITLVTFTIGVVVWGVFCIRHIGSKEPFLYVGKASTFVALLPFVCSASPGSGFSGPPIDNHSSARCGS